MQIDDGLPRDLEHGLADVTASLVRHAEELSATSLDDPRLRARFDAMYAVFDSQSGDLSNERVRHAIDVIARNGRLQAQLIEDILDISRIISKKLDIERSTVRVPGLVEAAVATLLPAARAGLAAVA